MVPVATREAPSVSRTPPRPGRYRHFKGGEYEVLRVARHSETEEMLVVYCSLDDPATTWVRPMEMFVDVIEGPGGTYPRFRRTSPTEQRSGGLFSHLGRWLRLPHTSLPRAATRSLRRRSVATRCPEL